MCRHTNLVFDLVPVLTVKSGQERIVQAVTRTSVCQTDVDDIAQPHQRPIVRVLLDSIPFEHRFRRIFFPGLQIITLCQSDSPIIGEVLWSVTVAATRIIKMPLTANTMHVRVSAAQPVKRSFATQVEDRSETGPVRRLLGPRRGKTDALYAIRPDPRVEQPPASFVQHHAGTLRSTFVKARMRYKNRVPRVAHPLMQRQPAAIRPSFFRPAFLQASPAK